MTTAVGRLREDRVLPNGIKLLLLSHNAKPGAAKGATLVAEDLVQRGLVSKRCRPGFFAPSLLRLP